MAICIVTREERGATIVTFTVRKILDEQWIQEMGWALFRLVDKLGIRKLILDFGELDYVSSAALGKFITLHNKLQNAGGKLSFCEIPNDAENRRDVWEVFEITKLDKFFRAWRQDPRNIGQTLGLALDELAGKS